MNRPMHDLLQTVSARLSLHMPAAQGRAPFEGIDPYLLDTTELPVTDDMFNPKGAIAEAERLIAKSAGARASMMLHGGSTAGVHAMILYACKRGDKIILPRNVHLSALDVCAVAGIHPVFAEMTVTPQGWAFTTADAYQATLEEHPDAKAALIVTSDYYGLMCDLPAVADAVHAKGKMVLCDEAHGAYFNWRRDVENAGRRGADLFVQSAHKTLPAINAAAWIHAMEGVDPVKLRTILRMIQTSSPSFAAMQSLDDARAWMDAYGRDACDRLLQALEAFRIKAAGLGFTDDQTGIPFDRLRLVLRAGQGGEWLQEKLQAEQIDVEMSDSDHVVCILSLIDGEERLRILLEALRRIAGGARADMAKPQPFKMFPIKWPERRMPLSEAMFADSETLPPLKTVGRISATNAGIYPPSVAWLTAGDAVTEEIAQMLCNTPAHRLFGLTGGLRCVK